MYQVNINIRLIRLHMIILDIFIQRMFVILFKNHNENQTLHNSLL